MNIIRYFSFLTIFGLLVCFTTGRISLDQSAFFDDKKIFISVAVGRQDDVDIGDDEDDVVVSRSETVTPASDTLVREKI